MRRPSVILLLLALVAVAPAGAAKPRSWADAEIKLVTARGLMGGNVASFRPDDTLTRRELAELAAALVAQAPTAPAQPRASVTIERLDSSLVRALGLTPAAANMAAEAKRAGVVPPARFGTETVARLLGLRKNHPAAQDVLERLPTDPASRAEAAYSAAQILRFGSWEKPWIEGLAGTFDIPALTEWQRRVLQTAFRFVGYPYIWGGTSERTQTLFGATVRGGFDCSGFVWRVYKLEPYAGGEALAGTLRGRTTFAMSGEIPRAKRIAFAKLAPADLVFFGNRGAASKPAEVVHMGIYVGGGWFVHSSRHGVALDPLSGWYRSRFAWGRRPLAEAGLATGRS